MALAPTAASEALLLCCAVLQVLVGMVLVGGPCAPGGELRVPLLSERQAEGSQASNAMAAPAAAATSSHVEASEHQGAAGSHSEVGAARVPEEDVGAVSTEEVEVATAEDCEAALDKAVAARECPLVLRPPHCPFLASQGGLLLALVLIGPFAITPIEGLGER